MGEGARRCRQLNWGGSRWEGKQKGRLVEQAPCAARGGRAVLRCAVLPRP